MRRLLLVAGLLPLAAHAAQDPIPRKEDPRVCDTPYDPNNVVRIRAKVGDNITVIFGKDEVIDPSGLAMSDSDDTHIGRTGPDNSNVLYFKAKIAMPEQPMAVRTTKNGEARNYTIEWSAIDPPRPKPVNVAAVGDAPVPEQKAEPPICWVVRYSYPADVKAEAAAKWKVAWRRKQEDEAEIALRAASVIRKVNIRYVAQGDTSLAPTEVWDNAGDGTQPRTEMHFSGRVPVILRPSGDDAAQDAQMSNVSIEDNGIVKIVGVYPLIRLRDGERVLCIRRVGGAPPSTNTTTGTVSPEVGRELNGRTR